MIKTFFISALLLSVTPAFAESTVQSGSTVTNVVSPTATQLVEKFGDKLNQYITVLASKAGVAADHFYPIFVRQQVITGIFELSLMAIGLISGIGLICLGISNDSEKNEAKQMFGMFGGSILTIIVAMCLITGGADSLSKVCNPEYHAVQSLVQMVR